MESRDENEPQPGPSTSADGACGGGEPKTLAEFLALPENKGANLVVPLSWCPHLDTCLAADAPETIEPKAPCMKCANVGENWICLKCLEVHCSRYVNEHMLFHGIDKGDDHRLSLSFSDLSVWCYACDSYVDNPMLDGFKNSLHVAKFGSEIPKRGGGTVPEGPTLTMG